MMGTDTGNHTDFEADDSTRTQLAQQLRDAFDKSFAHPPATSVDQYEEILLVRVGADPYAIRLAEITGITATRVIVAVPSTDARVLGLAGIRGNIIPVFDLAALLGYPSNSETTRWMVLCAIDEPIALAFAEFEGYERLPHSSLLSDAAATQREHVGEIAQTSVGARPVVNIRRLVATIDGRRLAGQPPQE